MEDTGVNLAAAAATLQPEIMQDLMDFLSRSWSVSALEVAKALVPPTPAGGDKLENAAGKVEDDDSKAAAGSSFTFACSATSKLVMDRILSQAKTEHYTKLSSDLSPFATGRLSHSRGPLNGGSLSDSPPVSPSDRDDDKYLKTSKPVKLSYREGRRTMGRWVKDRRERKKEETRAQNAQLHAAVSAVGVAAAVAAVSSATAGAAVRKDDRASRTSMAVASAATLVATHCVDAAEALGAERDHLTAAVASAVSVRTAGDIATLTAAAAGETVVSPYTETVNVNRSYCCSLKSIQQNIQRAHLFNLAALRGAATLKARVLKEVWNVAAVIPVEKGFVASQHRLSDGHSDGCSSGELLPEENFMELCSQELLARGSAILKRTRKGALHWKIVSVYIHRTGRVKLKMKSRHAAGTITKKKKNVVVELCKNIPAWPGRHLLEGGEGRRYFGLKTAEGRVIEFECRGEREYEMWTTGVSRLLSITGGKVPAAWTELVGSEKLS
ncbi:hypothetical protein AXF42_Ash014326 [Apostasia shenzhenica]|uniref:VAN3-binding protein n=1 Tax=Apostasia shenzhenica TaxID=1088818 RepID=A0A2I0B0V9_9ASPA|nr:hypothetical protein AXF42_Ash014326 [Apostasia shenzhenica]